MLMKIIKHGQHGDRHPMSLRDAMNRFFEESFWDPFGHLAEWPSFNRMGAVMHRYMPSIDVSEDEKEMRVVANIPGYDPKDVSVELEKGSLVIRGKNEEEKEDKDRQYYTRERACGEFYREIALPPYVDGEKAECKYKNGTLTVTIPRGKDKEKKHLRIDVG
jgi:HSP20 family protein